MFSLCLHGFSLGTVVSSNIPKMHSSGPLACHVVPVFVGVGVFAPCDGRASCPEGCSALLPELPGEAPATQDPELEEVCCKIMILLVFINLS